MLTSRGILGQIGANGQNMAGSGNIDGKPLKSWKAIAAFFGKDERTVKRWETKRGLPVHRLPGETHASVFAYPAELEGWLRRARHGDAEDLDKSQPVTPRLAPLRRSIYAGAVAGLVALTAVIGITTQFGGFSVAGVARSLGTDNAQANELYLSGVYHIALRSAEGIERARQYFNEAIALDPDFAAPYAGLAKVYNLISQYTPYPAEQAYPQAKSWAQKALALDPDLAEAHAALAFAAFYWDRDFQLSRDLFETALRLEPASAEVNHWNALALMQTGDFTAALAAIQKAQILDPQSRAIRANKGLVLYHSGRLAEAERELQHLIEGAPSFAAPYFYLADIYYEQGRFPEYLDQTAAAARIAKDEDLDKVARAARRGYTEAGVDGLLRASFAQWELAHAKGKKCAYKLARVATQLGEKHTAIAYLEESLAAREGDILAINIDHAFRDMRQDAKFVELVRRVGYNPQSPVVARSADPLRETN